jgi:two-component sensor histidine kinase
MAEQLERYRPVVKAIITQGAFYWLRVPKNAQDLRSDEWILAVIRLLLGVCYLGAILHPDSGFDLGRYELSSLAFLGYGILILAFLRIRRVQPPFFHIYIHCADIVWVTQLICLQHWHAMNFALLFFVIVSTAFRWGLWEAYLTSAIFYILFLIGQYSHNPSLVNTRLSMRPMEFCVELALYIGMVCMIGLLAEAKASLSESHSLARVLAGVRIAAGYEQALRAVNNECIRIFGAAQVLVVVQERSRNQALLFCVGHPQIVHPACEIDLSQHAHYLYPEPGTSVRLAIARSSGKKQFRCLTLKSGKIQKTNTCCDMPEAFLAAHPFRRLLAVAFAIEKDWTARVYVVDPRKFFGGASGLRFLQRCVSCLSPIIHDTFTVGRLVDTAEAVVSGKVARQLHDGTIQSLSLINIQLDDLSRQTGTISAPIVEPLKRMQQSIQKEIASLRDFMQQLRSLDIDSQNLLSFLAGMAVKFQVEHGIATRFVSDLDEVPFLPPICVELARIAQEALTNVRKHSDAREALVRLGRRNGDMVLSIIDNGRGFGFSGRRSHEELQASGEGPLILMERAKTINGKVSIESIQHSGACVEIAFPI